MREIRHGDLFDVLPTLEAESFDSGVTDPPYGIGFMGKEWDTFAPAGVEANSRKAFRMEHGAEHDDAYERNPNLRGRRRSPAMSPSQIEYDRTLSGQRGFQEWSERWAREVYRVLKPGAYLLVCGAPRSYHRMACGIEDAGFEVRDCFAWIFGQGYPKSLDVGRVVDMALCPEPSGHQMRRAIDPGDHVCAETELGRKWAGYGTGLKPSNEPILVARKPLTGTIAENVLKYGTGALNIAACRLQGDKGDGNWAGAKASTSRGDDGTYQGGWQEQSTEMSDLGRWPANVLLDELAAAMLDEAVGELVSGANPSSRQSDKRRTVYGAFTAVGPCTPARGQDTGGPSRFFYVAKPSREERDRGCIEGVTPRQRDESRKDGNPGGDNPRNRGLQLRGNHHPTVKPLELMRMLVRLVTPKGGRIIDPFFGSGTLGMAAEYEGFDYFGCDREAEYVEIAKRRVADVMPLLAGER